MENGLLIGEVAARSGVSRKALRLYESRGILSVPHRTPSGYRRYPADVLRLLSFVAQARRLLEEIDTVVVVVNETGVGMRFFAGLQMILQHELLLSVTRVFEPHSQRNPGRTLRAAAHHVATHAVELPIVNREDVFKFLATRGEAREAIQPLCDEQLSRALLQHLEVHLPRADPTSERPLDRALGQLKAVRDKALAHRERVDPASLVVPGWPHLVDLIRVADEALTLLAQAYLSVNYNLAGDASYAASSLRTLLQRAGLADDDRGEMADREP